MRFWLSIMGVVTLLPVPVRASEVFFERDVLPIFNNHCLACHGGVHQKNGLDLRTWESTLKGGANGAVIRPGHPDESVLWKKVHADDMPRTDNKVSAANKAILKAWIAGGARSSRDMKKEPRLARKVKKQPQEVASRIDRDIQKKLGAEKVPSSVMADDAEFLRRVYLDLTGNVPPHEKARAFLEDRHPQRRAKLVEEVLSSPDYGRHFATQWVNLFLLNTVNQRPPHPGPFIDWLADALNKGRPWDEVVRDILAAEGFLKDRPQGLSRDQHGILGDAWSTPPAGSLS